jgi:hypothetical protein
MSESNNKCFLCSATSDTRVLLKCEDEGKEKWVCVTCLPPLIHGAH